MLQLGFTYNNKPSSRRLADAAGVTVNAAQRVIFRENWGEATVVALGEAMRDPEFVAGWVGMPAGEAWNPPTDARWLSARQRALVEDLIRELAGKGGQQRWWDTGGPEDDDDGGGDVIDFPGQRPPATGRRAARSPDSAPDEFDT